MISYALANKKFILAVISYALANKKFIQAVISYALANKKFYTGSDFLCLAILDINLLDSIRTMSLFGSLRRTLKRGVSRTLGAVRRVGKASSNLARRGTNAVGLTRRRRCSRGSRRR